MTKSVATHQRWRSFLAASQALWILFFRKHATTSHVFHCLLLNVRRGVGIFSRCASIGVMHKLFGFQMHYKTGFEHRSLMHQWRLSTKHPRCKIPWISCRRSKNQFLMHQYRLPLKSSRFKNSKSKCQWFKNQRCKSQQFQWFKNQMRARGSKNIPRSKNLSGFESTRDH